MDFENFSTSDFIKDESFQQWVFSPEEQNRAFWKAFLEEHPHKTDEVNEARQFLMIFDAQGEDILESKIAHLKKRIDLALDEPTTFESIRESVFEGEFKFHEKKKAQKIKTYALAASICLFLISSFFLFYWFQGGGGGKISGDYEMVTPKGQRSIITLFDGTRVWLNADSRLDYPESFAGKKTREVYLEGEAFFDVTENKEQPFIVNTSDLKVKVLGTAFNVRSYKKDNLIETTLVRGQVSISSKAEQGSAVILRPNQKVVYEKKSGKLMLKNQVDTEKSTSWRDGKLYFEDEAFSEIVKALERWYNVTIHVENTETLGCRFSAKIDNKTLEEVLDLFKFSENIDYRIDERVIYISGKLCGE